MPSALARSLLPTALVAAAALAAAPRLPAADPRHRMILITDLLGEQDDSQMLVRLLMYSNELDIEGLIAVTLSEPWYPARDPSQPHRIGVHPEEFVTDIDAYSLVRPNLLKNAPGWPTRQELMSKVGAGPYGYGMAAVGDGQSTPGTRLIERAIEKDDPRPLYICITGGANPLAQALWDLRRSHTPEQLKALIARVRVYEDYGQDDAGAWICHSFPDIFWIRSLNQVFGLMGPGPPHIPPGMSQTERDPWVWQPYPPTDAGEHEWMHAHVQRNHGPLGALYPDRTSGNGRYRYLEGGNTATWIGLVNYGLYDPEHVSWGGWGGRFLDRKVPVPAGQDRVRYGAGEDPYRPFAMYPDASDRWTDPDTGRTYDDVWTPIQRWRRAFEDDFQARMDWCVKDFKHANHNPIAAFDGDLSRTIVRLRPAAGQRLDLDASASRDPDGDRIFFRWYPYPEAGTYPGPVTIEGGDRAQASLRVPADAAGRQIHVILEVRDDNPAESLYAYRRVVLDVQGR